MRPATQSQQFPAKTVAGQSGTESMKRMLAAFYNSIAAWKTLIRSERAFQEETVALAIGIPLAFVISDDLLVRFVLIGAIIFVMIVEVLNTGIEAACNALSREFHADIKIAKDCGSLAVLLSILLAGGVWALAVHAWWIAP